MQEIRTRVRAGLFHAGLLAAGGMLGGCYAMSDVTVLRAATSGPDASLVADADAAVLPPARGRDAAISPPDPSRDAGAVLPPRFDASVTPPIPGIDAGSTQPPFRVDGGPPMVRDAGVATGSLACSFPPGLGLPPGTDTSVPSGGGYGVDVAYDSLRTIATGMVGVWTGTQRSPWEPEHDVTVAFYADGSYSASCEGGACLPFYYGEFCPDHRGFWRFEPDATGAIAATLRIYFLVSGTSTDESLRGIVLQGDSLVFDQWHFGSYGPIHFDLHRVTAP